MVQTCSFPLEAKQPGHRVPEKNRRQKPNGSIQYCQEQRSKGDKEKTPPTPGSGRGGKIKRIKCLQPIWLKHKLLTVMIQLVHELNLGFHAEFFIDIG